MLAFGIEEGSWYMQGSSGKRSWRERCRTVLEDATEKRTQEDKLRKRRKAVELASVPSDTGRTSPDTDVSPLALKVK